METQGIEATLLQLAGDVSRLKIEVERLKNLLKNTASAISERLPTFDV